MMGKKKKASDGHLPESSQMSLFDTEPSDQNPVPKPKKKKSKKKKKKKKSREAPGGGSPPATNSHPDSAVTPQMTNSSEGSSISYTFSDGRFSKQVNRSALVEINDSIVRNEESESQETEYYDTHSQLSLEACLNAACTPSAQVAAGNSKSPTPDDGDQSLRIVEREDGEILNSNTPSMSMYYSLGEIVAQSPKGSPNSQQEKEAKLHDIYQHFHGMQSTQESPSFAECITPSSVASNESHSIGGTNGRLNESEFDGIKQEPSSESFQNSDDIALQSGSSQTKHHKKKKHKNDVHANGEVEVRPDVLLSQTPVKSKKKKRKKRKYDDLQSLGGDGESGEPSRKKSKKHRQREIGAEDVDMGSETGGSNAEIQLVEAHSREMEGSEPFEEASGLLPSPQSEAANDPPASSSNPLSSQLSLFDATPLDSSPRVKEKKKKKKSKLSKEKKRKKKKDALNSSISQQSFTEAGQKTEEELQKLRETNHSFVSEFFVDSQESMPSSDENLFVPLSENEERIVGECHGEDIREEVIHSKGKHKGKHKPSMSPAYPQTLFHQVDDLEPDLTSSMGGNDDSLEKLEVPSSPEFEEGRKNETPSQSATKTKKRVSFSDEPPMEEPPMETNQMIEDDLRELLESHQKHFEEVYQNIHKSASASKSKKGNKNRKSVESARKRKKGVNSNIDVMGEDSDDFLQVKRTRKKGKLENKVQTGEISPHDSVLENEVESKEVEEIDTEELQDVASADHEPTSPSELQNSPTPVRDAYTFIQSSEDDGQIPSATTSRLTEKSLSPSCPETSLTDASVDEPLFVHEMTREGGDDGDKTRDRSSKKSERRKRRRSEGRKKKMDVGRGDDVDDMDREVRDEQHHVESEAGTSEMGAVSDESVQGESNDTSGEELNVVELAEALHRSNTCSDGLSREVMEAFAADGVKIRRGVWTQEERNQLLENWNSFFQQHHFPFDRYRILDYRLESQATRKEIASFISKTKFFVKLGHGILRRNSAIYNAARSIFHPEWQGHDNVANRFTEDDKKIIKEYFQRGEAKLKPLADELKRPLNSLKAFLQRNKHLRTNGEARPVGRQKWTLEDDRRLLSAVLKVADCQWEDVSGTMEGIPYAKIAEVVPPFTSVQCRSRWLCILVPFLLSHQNGLSWGPEYQLAVLESVASNMKEGDHIDWEAVQWDFEKPYPLQFLRSHWSKIVAKIPNGSKLSLKALIGALKKKYVPIWQQKLSDDKEGSRGGLPYVLDELTDPVVFSPSDENLLKDAAKTI